MGILGGILGDLVKPVTDIVGKAVVDKDKKRELDYKVRELIDQADKRYHEQMMGQIEVNKEEAKHPSIFVAGWRPFIGWTGGVSIAYTFLVSPFANQIAKWFGYSGEMVALDTSSLMVLITGMLGIGGMRSFEKVKEVDTKKIGNKKPEYLDGVY
jgi:hypothetical protein